MDIGFFGGRFDPIHNGHLALARAAMDHCGLNRIYFVPAGSPPHKPGQPLTSFPHRYAMVALATASEKSFVPSLLEAPREYGPDQIATKPPLKSEKKEPDYTIHTVRRLKATLKKNDRLFLLIGIDAFADISKWHQPEALLEECEFIVSSRPGYSLADVAKALPPSLRPKAEITELFKKHGATGELRLRGVTIHLLTNVQQTVSATAIREAARAQKPLGRLVPSEVSDYIRKTGLYRAL